MTPLTRLIEELKIDIHNAETVIKKISTSECQKKIYTKQKDTLNDIVIKIENNYLNVELDFINKTKKNGKL